MDIMELGAVGELVGGVAVIATLIYLALQVRQGNKESRRESYRTWVSELNRVWFEPMRDPDYMELLQQAALDWDSLSLREQGTVNAVYAPTLLLLQEVFVQREEGATNAYLRHQADAVTASILQMPGPAKWWAMNGAFFAPEFFAHTDRLLAADGCPPPLHHSLPWYAATEAR